MLQSKYNQSICVNNTKHTEQSHLDTNKSMEKKTSSSHNDSSSSYEGWSAAHVQFYQAKEMKKWTLLDNRSTVDLFCNPNLVTNIHTTTKTLEVSMNGGKLFTNQKATVPNYGEVWYNPNAVTNIFSLYEMEKKHRITYDSTKEKAFTVHLPNKEVKFSKSSNGLYFHKPTYNTNLNENKTTVHHTIIPITASVKSFSHIMIAGVDDNINFAGVARNTAYKNDINIGKLAEISKNKPYQTLVEFVDISTKTKKAEENYINDIKTVYKTRLLWSKTPKSKITKKFKEKTEEEDNKEDKD
jgi:hypothetical protein